MGTIAQKLEYLNDTRLLLKDNINKINNVLDDNSTFRSYPQELFNGYLDILNNGTDTLWNNLEKVSASGETPVLENVETAPIKMVLNGNTSQDTTTGKNLFTTDYLTSNSFTTYTKLTDNSFSFTATGTWKKASYKVPCKPNTDYYFNISSASSMYIQIKGVQTGRQVLGKYSAYLISFNSGENTELEINIGVGGNSIASETISDIQLEEGTTATSFEKYTGGIPSPNPDYPQEVKVVKGENVVSVSGKNLFDKSSVSLGSNWNGAIGTTCYPFNSQITRATVLIPVEPSTTYHLKLTQSEWYSMQILEASSTYEVLQTDSSVVSNNVDLQITTLSNTAYIGIKFKYGSAGTTEMVESLLSSLILMLNKGTTALPYEPYTGASYPINLPVGMELCKINTYKDYFHKDSGKWYVHKEIEKGIYNLTREGMVLSNKKWFYFNKPSNSIDIGTYNTNAITEVALTGGGQSTLDIFFSGNGGVALYAIVYRNVETAPTLAELQEKVNGKSYYYVLKTPTEEEITNTTLIEQLEAISKAKSVKDKTYITQTNDGLPFILDVEAIKEYEVN